MLEMLPMQKEGWSGGSGRPESTKFSFVTPKFTTQALDNGNYGGG